VLSGTRLFSVRKIPVHAHWSAFIIVALISVNIGSAAGLLVAVIAALAFLLSILLHELAHALVARRFGVGTDRITLWGLGGIASLDRDSPSPRAEGWTAFAGPACSAALGAFGMGAAGLFRLADVDHVSIDVLFWLGIMNAGLAVFNLLPGAPLDGGRIVSAWRWSRHGDRFRAREEAAHAGVAVGMVVTAAGTFLVLRGVGGLMLPMTGLFIAINAATERQGARAARRLEGISVRDLTWFGIAQADASTSVSQMLWERSRLGGAGLVAVTDSAGEITGVVTEDRMLKVPEERRDSVRLAQLMIPQANLARLSPDDSLVHALARISPFSPVVTVWSGTHLIGTVPTERLRRELELH
jgi:Zn-dependent protease